MFAIIKKGSRQIYKIHNSFDTLFPNEDELKRDAWQYTLETFGCFQGHDAYYYYIKDAEYEPGRDMYLWHHLLQKNWMFASYNAEDIPKGDIFTVSYKYFEF